MFCKCSDCGCTIDINKINTQPFIYKNKRYVVDFILCPNCKHVDIVCIKDAKYFRLAESLTDSVERISKMQRYGVKPETYAYGVKSAQKKKQRLSNHVEKLKSKFDGIFTVEDYMLSDGTITDALVYHETK